MKYKNIIELSNNIRCILETSRQLQLASVNAALAARRVGNVRGFQAVAGELKVFSHKLENEMSAMSQHGSIYQGDDVQRFIKWFADLPVGMEELS